MKMPLFSVLVLVACSLLVASCSDRKIVEAEIGLVAAMEELKAYEMTATNRGTVGVHNEFFEMWISEVEPLIAVIGKDHPAYDAVYSVVIDVREFEKTTLKFVEQFDTARASDLAENRRQALAFYARKFGQPAESAARTLEASLSSR